MVKEMEENINLDDSEVERISIEIANYLRTFSGEDKNGIRDVAYKMMEKHYGLNEEEKEKVFDKIEEF